MVMQTPGSNGNAPPSPESKILERSVVNTPSSGQIIPTDQNFVLWLGAIADAITPWGQAPKQRDRQLRQFMPTEPYFLSGLSTMCARNAAFNWVLEGPEQSVAMAQEMLLNSNRGLGWENWIIRESIDVYTQDIGGWVEIIHQEPANPKSPVINIAHIDAGRCYPTGDPEKPLLYMDRMGKFHTLMWWQCYQLCEMPSPVESFGGPLYNIQFSALTRLLKEAQIIRSVEIYQDEKISGRNESAIHLVKGVDVQKLEDALGKQRTWADSQGYQRYLKPALVGSHNPEADVGHDTIEMASLPDGFEQESTMKWYISAMAMAFNVEYQDFAPLPSGNLGSGKQSEILHEKARGKGPALWQKLIEHFLNYSGVLPSNVTFKFNEQDIQAEMDEAQVSLARAQARAADITSAVIDPEAGLRMMLDDGDISQEIYDDLEKRREEQKKQQATQQAAAQEFAGAALTEEKKRQDAAAAQVVDGTNQQQQGQDQSAEASQPLRPKGTKAHVPPGRIDLEDEVEPHFDNIMAGVHERMRKRIRELDKPTVLEMDQKAYEQDRPRKALRTLRSIVSRDTKGRAQQVLEEEIA